MKKAMLFMYSLLFVIFSHHSTNAQSKSNMEIITNLVGKSVSETGLKESQSEFSLHLLSPTNYEILNNVASSFFSTGNKINSQSSLKVEYSITDLQVNYPDVFRDGWFGNFLLEREIKLNGNYSIAENGKRKSEMFSISAKDTVSYDELSFIENPSLPFTRGNVPEEPFFSGIWEPVVAVAAIVTTVYLFFSVRSN